MKYENYTLAVYLYIFLDRVFYNFLVLTLLNIPMGWKGGK